MNASTHPSPEPARHAPIALWRIARAFIVTLHSIFGSPGEIAEEGLLKRKAHAMLVSWIACAEAMLRRLLLIEAAHYAARPAPKPRPRKKRERLGLILAFHADKPEAWRVHFNAFGPERGEPAAAGKHRHPTPAPQFGVIRRHDAGGQPVPRGYYSAWPLAQRYQALLNVFNDPAPYARRLATRLRIKPARIKEILHAPESAKHRVEDFAEMGELGEQRWAALTDTS